MATIRLKQNRINPLVLPVILANELGFFKHYQVDVNLELADDFIFNGKSDFLDGEVDAQMGDTTFFFYYIKEGKKTVITSTLTRTIQLVGYNNWKQLDNFRVGINRTGLFRFFYDTYLKNDLPTTSYHWINNTYDRIDALKNHKIDALVAIEPFVSTVLRLPNTGVLWHSKDIDACYVMWCFDERFVKENPQDVRNFHLALEDAARYFNKQTSERKIDLLMDYCHFDLDKASSFNQFFFEPQHNYSPKDFNLCQQWMLENDEINFTISESQGIFETF